MHFIVYYIKRYFNADAKRKKLLFLYDRLKFELPFYLDELALYKFILERQIYTPTEREYYLKKHTDARCNCLKAINRFDNLVCDLALENRYEAHTYMEQYKQYSELFYNKPRMPYFELSYN